MDIIKLAALLLVLGGLVHTIPPLNSSLTSISGGTPLIQIIVGVISVIFGIVLLVRRYAQS